VIATVLVGLGDQHTLTRMDLSLACEHSIIIVFIGVLLEVGVLHGLMIFSQMVFGKIIGAIGIARVPENVEWPCHMQLPIQCISMALECFCLTMSLMMPQAVLLSVWRGVSGCGWPSSSKAVQMGHAVCALRNSAPSSASAALATTCHIIWHRTCKGPLSGGVGSVAVGVASSRARRK